MRTRNAGHLVFSLTMIGVGLLGLINGDLTAIWAPVPKGAPARAIFAYVCALISIVCGIGLLWKRMAAAAARVLLAYLLLWLIVFRIPGLLRTPTIVDIYWSACQTAVMVGAAWVLYVWFATDWDKQRLTFATGDNGLRIARAFYGLALIPFGISHFQYLKYTASLVPSWLPGHLAWASFFGATFIAAGIAILIGLWARLAASLSAVQMGIFTLLVWVPSVAKGSANNFQWGEILISWVLTAAAWVVADSYRAGPGLVGEEELMPPHSAK